MINVMAFTRARIPLSLACKAAIFHLVFFACILQSCKSDKKKIYQSNCDDGISFKRVGFTQLIDSIDDYDQQYVEVYGTYEEGKEESALVNDSTFVDHSSERAIWVNFSQDCPLYLTGTHQGLFEYNDGKFTQLNNKSVTIRGKIDVRHKGHLGSYKGSIDRISFVKM
jgi:hypothetical protein